MMQINFYFRVLFIALCLLPGLAFGQANSPGNINTPSGTGGAISQTPPSLPAPATPSVATTNAAPASLPSVNVPSSTTPAKVNSPSPNPSPVPAAVASAPAAVAAPPAPKPLQEEMPFILNGNKIDASALLLSPIHTGDTSLMFTPEEIQLIAPFFVLYDGNKDNTQQNKNNTNQDDLSSLLDTIKSQSKTTTQPEVPKVLPNIYLGSIVYYSPTQWSIWLNGKKLLNTRNAPENSLYIPRISRTEIELVWKPPSLLDIPITWAQLTENGQKPLENIFVDKDKGTITVHLHPNQTFISSRLMIHEGLIKTPTPQPQPSQ